MTNRILLGSALGTALVGVVLAVAVGGAFAHSTGATPLPAATCSPIQNPDGDLLVASDLPLQGSGRSQTHADDEGDRLRVQRGRLEGREVHHRLPELRRLRPLRPASGIPTPARRTRPTTPPTPASSGVIGTFNSGCAEIEIPIANRAPNGPLAMVSPANTYVGLTHAGPGTAAGEPGKYYPTGKRNYARVVAADDFQGAADATLAQQLKIRKLFVLNDKEAYGAGVATNVKNAAKKLGITVVKYTGVRPEGDARTRRSPLQIKSVGRTGRLSRRADLRERRQADQGHPRRALRSVAILAPDGFTPVLGGRPAVGRQGGGHVHLGRRSPERQPACRPASSSSRTFAKTTDGGVAARAVLGLCGAGRRRAARGRSPNSDGTRAASPQQLFKVNSRTGSSATSRSTPNGDVTVEPGHDLHGRATARPSVYKVIVPALAGERRLAGDPSAVRSNGEGFGPPRSFQATRRSLPGPSGAAPGPAPTRRSCRSTISNRAAASAPGASHFVLPRFPSRKTAVANRPGR